MKTNNTIKENKILSTKPIIKKKFLENTDTVNI